VRTAADAAVARPRLSSRSQIVAPLAPLHVDAVMTEARRTAGRDERAAAFGGQDNLPEEGEPRNLATSINAALVDLMVKYPQVLVFGEDVAQKGGVYYVTAGLHKKFKAARVFNTLLDEQTILGLAQGMGTMGMLPVPEIQYLAYFHNACDQIRGEACSLQFFSQDQFRNPMIVRIASLAYQKGFGGHFHNDNSIAALRDIPSLIVACPSRGDDAAAMLRTCAALAKVDGRIIAFLEPIALYVTKDLFEEGDGEWLFPYPPPPEAIRPGEPRVYHPQAKDLLMVTYGNGVPMSLKAARELKRARGVETRIVDLRWLLPLNEEAILEHAGDIGRVVVVDEGRRSGGVGEAILALLAEQGGGRIHCRRVVGDDTYIPLGPAAELVLPSIDDILRTASILME
jgi:2-oxoisovalerate dehydrogenase E1 component